MADRERSRSPERGDEGDAPAPAPADDYQAPAASADNDAGGDANDAAANGGGATDDSVKLYVGNLHYGMSQNTFDFFVLYYFSIQQIRTHDQL